MNEEIQKAHITGFLEGTMWAGHAATYAEVGDITHYLRRAGLVDGGDEVAILVHSIMVELHHAHQAERELERKGVLTSKSIDKATALNQMLFNKAGRAEWQGREVVRVLALEGDKIRLFYELDATDPDKYTDVPYNTHLRITR